MTNIAVIGAGGMGSVHARACAELPDITVAWVVDQDVARAEALAADVGGRATGDMQAALDDAVVDAVVVAVPTPLHRPLTERAAAHGKHVFCEKPIALNVEDARAMIGACQQAGVRLMVGHVVRFFPEYARIKEMLDDDAIGQVGVVRSARLNQHPPADRAWFTRMDESGGLVVDLMIHEFDTLRWFFGDVERVYAHGLSFTAHQAMSDHAVALLRFENGVIAHVEGSWAHANFRTAIEIAGSEGIIDYSREESAPLWLERSDPEVQQRGIITRFIPANRGPYHTELHHFVDRIADGQPFLTEGEDGLRALEIALATLDSIRTGQPVHFAAGHPTPREVAR
ncbi:MAG: Gfo/Idh/MocA family protein [Thermomicrobiales bacterium]